MAAKTMEARYNGKCHICKGAIKAGTTIRYERATGAAHPECYVDLDALPACDDVEYRKGYHEVREIQAISAPGSALREQLYMEMEMAAYNRGED